MRACGEIDDIGLLGPYDNLCWAYQSRAEFERRMLEFVSSGLARGQQVWYVADRPEQEMRRVLCALDGADEAITTGAARVVNVATWARTTDPETQARACATAVDKALADGYTGLRIAVDSTELVARFGRIDHMARYEHLLDRYLADRPFAALCAYDRSQLGTELVSELACMHPVSNVGAAPFHLFATDDADIALSGELDLGGRRLLGLALERADPRPHSGELTVDAGAVTFIDHRCLLVLGRFARHHGATAVVRTHHSTPLRLAEILDLPDVRVVPSAR